MAAGKCELPHASVAGQHHRGAGTEFPNPVHGSSGEGILPARSFEVVLSMLGTRTRFNEMVSVIVNQYAGQLTRVICSEEPSLYAIGTLEMAPAYDR